MTGTMPDMTHTFEATISRPGDPDEIRSGLSGDQVVVLAQEADRAGWAISVRGEHPASRVTWNCPFDSTCTVAFHGPDRVDVERLGHEHLAAAHGMDMALTLIGAGVKPRPRTQKVRLPRFGWSKR